MEIEFESIEQKKDWNRIYAVLRSKSESESVPFCAAQKVEHRKFNRYTDVLPFDHTRVILQTGDVDYINANTVCYEPAQRKYILTQGPLGITVAHFWLMVWEQHAPAIIMLNRIIEKRRIKCHKYWPDPDDILEFEELGLTVHLINEENNKNYIVRLLRITDIKSNESREVRQYQYTEWPDFGIPQCHKFIQFLDLVRGSGLLSCLKGPPVIHCSAGIGRSGTFCLVDVILKLLEDGTVKNDGDIDVHAILLELRKSRIGLIQTPDQLKFAYIVLIEAIRRRKEFATIQCKEPHSESKQLEIRNEKNDETKNEEKVNETVQVSIKSGDSSSKLDTKECADINENDDSSPKKQTHQSLSLNDCDSDHESIPKKIKT